MLKRGSKPGKSTRCTKCGRSRKGHEGPCGIRCTMSNANILEVEWLEDTDPPRSESPNLVIDAQSPFVRELARQMSELTMNVSRILATQSPTPTMPGRPAHTREHHRRSSTPDATPSESASRKPCTGPCCAAGNNDAPVALTNGARITRKTIVNAKAGECTLISSILCPPANPQTF